ncbi:DNA repair SWI5-like protein [Vairimorpha necatrix]|uniref:DNA repair SWI5-like protein n=1 Tax=Vairimorpha necatrix TaxID=6039 RepID=A0AAX4J7Y1_9MICR
MSSLLNNWSKDEIIHKDKILYFDILISKSLISNIQNTEYFTLSKPVEIVEYEIYKYFNEKMIDKMNIEDCTVEIKKFIKDLHVYNELKDIGQSLVNKIAERRKTTSKEIIKEMGYDLLI